MGKMKADEIITNEFMEKILNNDLMPWEFTWSKKFPKSVKTGKRYHGWYNNFRLQFGRVINGYNSSLWGTFKAWGDLNRNIKKGSKSTLVTYGNMIYKLNGKNIKNYESLSDKDKKDCKMIFFRRYYRVFNFDQTTGKDLPKKYQDLDDQEYEVLPIDQIDNVIDAMPNKPKIFNDGMDACYHPVKHEIHMPKQSSFISYAVKKHNDKNLGIPFYYDALLHEIIHSTGHKNSLDRKLLTNNKKNYAIEELIAEIGCNILMNRFDINNDKTDGLSLSYIKGWNDALNKMNNKNRKEKIQLLKDNKDQLISICEKSIKAVEFILNENKQENKKVC